MSKAAIDRYIEREPDNGFQDFCEAVDDKFTDEFFYDQRHFIDTPDGTCNTWLNKLFAKEISPLIAAEIIERAFKFYKL
jgi:hypothetical protein